MSETRKFQLGDRVTKTKGSSWTGRIVGVYSTGLTPEGYAVESETEKGSVQIYPASALAPTPSPPAGGEAVAVGLTAYTQGVVLLSLVREIANGTRSYPAAYQRGHTLVGLGLAEYAEPLIEGQSYWLRLTDAGRALSPEAGR